MAMAEEEPVASKALRENWLKQKVTLDELLKYVQNVDEAKLASKLMLDGLKLNPELSDVCSLWLVQQSPTKGDVGNVLSDFGIEITDQFKSEMSSQKHDKTSPILTDTATGQSTPPLEEDQKQTTADSPVDQENHGLEDHSPSLQRPIRTRILHYGIGNITKPIGVPVRYRESKRKLTIHSDIVYNYTSTFDLIKDQDIKVKVRPMLVSFGGLPESGMSTTLEAFLDYHVEECPSDDPMYVPITKKSKKPKEVGITQYDLIADGSDPLAKFTLTEAMKESYFTFGVLSAFKNILTTQGKVPVLDNTGERPRCFKDDDLENFFMQMYQYLCHQPTIANSTESADKIVKTASGLAQSLPDSLTLVNIWDHSIKNTVRHLLSALQGHLYNHHMFLFLDLERDLNNLDEPLEIDSIDREGAVFMKWRPRLHYLLHSAWATEGKEEERRRACTLFAKSKREYSREVRGDIEKLEDNVEPVAKHIGVAKLLDKKIEAVHLGTEQKPFYGKVQHIASSKPPERIPLSWLFLRSSFYHSNKIVMSKKELLKKATECGMNDESLSGFCKFYTSFGSIIDLSLANPNDEYVITKPVLFLNLLNELLFPSDDKLEQHPTIKLGVLPESYCKDSLDEHDWSSFMDALVSLELATKVTDAILKLPSDYSIDPMEMHYYVSLCCRDEPKTEVDPHSVHLIINIDTPHFFKQVTIAKQLLKSMNANKLKAKLCASSNVNEIVIKACDTRVRFAFHSSVIKIHLDDPNSIVCTHVVKAFNEIAESAYSTSGIKIKYKFVTMCAFQNEDISNVQSLLSSRYHVLPYTDHCETCTADGRDNELLKVWNEALENHPIPNLFMPTGDIDSKELSHIVEKMMGPNLIDPDVFAETFIPDYTRFPQFYQLTGERLIREVLFAWYDSISQNRNGGPEPRRALAERLIEVGNKIAKQSCNEPQKIKVLFERLAKRVDAYWRIKPVMTDGELEEPFDQERADASLRLIEQLKDQVQEKNEQLRKRDEKLEEYSRAIIQLIQSNKHLTNDDISKLAVILKPVEDGWYQLGKSLGIKESLLEEIKEKGKESPLECLLQITSEEPVVATGSTMTEIESGVQNMPPSSPVSKKSSVEDKGFQFDYLIPLMDNLESLNDVHIAGKKLFLIQGNVPQLMNWEQYGLRIGISKGSLMHSETVEAAVVALVGGQFVFPDNSKLVSAVYAVSVSKPLLQPLRLEIQHCIKLTSDAQTKYLKFAIAPVNTSSLPYQFSPVEGGQFTVGEWYGSINRKEFCLVCIIEEQDNDDPIHDGDEGESNNESDNESNEDEPSDIKTQKDLSSQEMEEGQSLQHRKLEKETKQSTSMQAKYGKGVAYTGLVYYEVKGVEDLVTFTATKKLNALIQYIKKEHPFAEIRQNVIFYIKSSHDYIELIFDNASQVESIAGWDVKPLVQPARLHRDTIDNFGGADYPIPPKSLISIYGSPFAVPILNYAVPFEGVTDALTIIIRIAQKEHPHPRTFSSSSSSSDFLGSITEESLASIKSDTKEDRQSTGDLKLVKKKLEQVLFNNEVALTDAFKHSLPGVANELLEVRIITRDIKMAPSYDKFIESFLAGVNLKRNLPNLEGHCIKFLKALLNVGGPVADAADLLRDEWKDAMKNEMGVELMLNV